MSKLYEIRFQRQGVQGLCVGLVLDAEIQVVEALSEFEAGVRLGQLFPNDDFYIHVIEVKQVG
jgi:hypothetical protein